MTNNIIAVTEGTGKNVATETIGTTDYQKIKIVGGETGSTSVLGVTPDGSIKVSVIGVITTNQPSILSIQSGIRITSVSGIVQTSVQGTVNISGTPSISGTVNIAGNPSISGTVIASIQGNVNIASIFGSLYPYAQPDSFVSGVTSVITGTTAASVVAAPGSALRNYITQVTVTNAAAVGTFVDIKDSGANILISGFAAASGGGFTATFPVPLKQLTTNASIDVISRTQASVIAAASGFKAA